jgi:GTP-sensing pleiotropic transcriptional regulator CodY
MQDPASVGCVSLHAAEPPVVRTNLKDAVPCVAIGVDSSVASVAVTFAHGIDLDAVPFALDAADRLGAARAVLAVRARDITESTGVITARSLRSITVTAL